MVVIYCGKIHFLCKGSNNNVWRCSFVKVWPKIFADVLEREVRVVESPNLSTASGAAMLASIGLNYLKAEEIESKISKVYSPDIRNNDLYRKGFSYFVSYYWRNRKDMKRINAQV